MFKSTSLPLIPSYAARRGRAPSAKMREAYGALAPQYNFDVEEGRALHPRDLFDRAYDAYRLEIGLGAGEHILHQARQNRDTGMIGSEVFTYGIAKMMCALARDPAPNLRIYHGDGRHVLRTLEDACLERVYILFPDPWPKRRHHKRRIINEQTLQEVRRVLIPSGVLRIATDHYDYLGWIIAQMQNVPQLEWSAREAEDIGAIPNDHIATRYQQKALEEGRENVVLDFVKL